MQCCRCSTNDFVCHILLLDESNIQCEIHNKTKGQEILDKVFLHLNLLEKDYFGLRYIDQTSQSRWLDPLKTVVEQLKSGPTYLLYFCVKFYPADPCRLQEEVTRYQVFLQVKRDIYQGRLPCSGKLLADLAAYVLQSELGDYDPRVHVGNYVSEFRFLPNQSEELEIKIEEVHKKIGGLVPAVAEFMYLDKVKWMEMYGVDLHPAKGDDFVEYFIAVKPAGIAIFKNKTKVGSYNWVRIQKLDFKGKKFYMTVKGKEDVENTYKFFLQSKAAAKHLWKCCLEHHAFFRLERTNDTSRRGSFSGLFRTGSGFRYSGRTQKEALEDGRRINRKSPDIIRKQSKRYERRISQANEKAHSTPGPASVTSLSQVQVKDLTQGPGAHSETTVTTPVRGPVGAVTETRADPTSVDGNTTADQAARGPALPWEQLAQSQGGLYTRALDSSGSFHSRTGSGRWRKRSPKFPRPHRRSAGPSSGSETDIPSRRRSRAAYSSDEDSGRRRRKRCRHRHRHGAHSADSASDRDTPSRGGRRNLRTHSEPEDFAKLPDSAPYHWPGEGRRHRGGSSDERPHHRHKHRSEGDARSDGSSRYRYSRQHSDHGGSELVPALDVIQSRVSVARVKEGSARQRHHRHHRHSHQGYPSSESGYSAMSAPPAPRHSKVLLELGPETANGQQNGDSSQRAQRVSGLYTGQATIPRGSGTRDVGYYTGQGTYPRTRRGPYESDPRVKLNYGNGVVAGERPLSNRYTMNGNFSSPQSTYIERVTGPSKAQMEAPPPYSNISHGHAVQPGKSTVL